MRIRPPTPGPTVADTNLPAGAPPTGTPTGAPMPTVLHIGSGKSFHEPWLNLDIDPAWGPDIVADLEQPFPGDREVFETARFGPCRIVPGTFEAVVAHDVLEHVRNLTTCMRSCLDVLRQGGVLHAQVPYDLSLGAWQDPTHVRAFNENSWLYYTDWCWYLGWTDWHFELAALDFTLSAHGEQLERRGIDGAEILRTPRAVDAMVVQLVKRPVPPAIAAAAEQQRRGAGHPPA